MHGTPGLWVWEEPRFWGTCI